MKHVTKNLFLSFVTALALAPQVLIAMQPNAFHQQITHLNRLAQNKQYNQVKDILRSSQFESTLSSSSVKNPGAITFILQRLYNDSRFTRLQIFFSYLRSWPLLKKFVLPTFVKNMFLSLGISIIGLFLLHLAIHIPFFYLIKKVAPWSMLLGALAITFYDFSHTKY